MMTLSGQMFEQAEADRTDGERLVDYPRYVPGVEIAVLVRQTVEDESEYKFSLRSNGRVDVAQLAARFGGGGHARAAGFERRGPLATLKMDFLREAVRFLDGNSAVAGIAGSPH
jgi:phosphoesterase RecJ-like protein